MVLTATWFFIAGSALGSFYNVIIERLPNDRDIVKARSSCNNCHTQLKWYDLIPFLSFFLLRGRCRYCGAKLSWQYPLSEFAVGSLFLLAFVQFNSNGWNPAQLVLDLVLWSMLYIVALMDYKYGIIIDQILLVFALLGFGALLWRDGHVLDSLTGAIAGFVFYGIIYICARLVYRKEGFGVGDILLLASIGIFLGPVQTVIAGFLAFYICIPFIVIWLFRNKALPYQQALPFGPQVCIAAFIMSLHGVEITNWVMGVFKLPFTA